MKQRDRIPLPSSNPQRKRLFSLSHVATVVYCSRRRDGTWSWKGREGAACRVEQRRSDREERTRTPPPSVRVRVCSCIQSWRRRWRPMTATQRTDRRHRSAARPPPTHTELVSLCLSGLPLSPPSNSIGNLQLPVGRTGRWPCVVGLWVAVVKFMSTCEASQPMSETEELRAGISCTENRHHPQSDGVHLCN